MYVISIDTGMSSVG